MPDIETMMFFISTVALFGVVPGPDNIFVLTQSALVGPRAGVAVAAGLCLGLLVHTIAVAAGLAALMQTTPIAFTMLKYVGAAYLLYLAWGAFRAKPGGAEATALPTMQAHRLVMRGVVMNLSNPKVAIFMLAFLPQFVDQGRGDATLQLLVLGVTMAVVSLMVFAVIAFVSGALGNGLKSHPAAETVLQRIAGVVFVGLAARLVLASNN